MKTLIEDPYIRTESALRVNTTDTGCVTAMMHSSYNLHSFCEPQPFPESRGGKANENGGSPFTIIVSKIINLLKKMKRV